MWEGCVCVCVLFQIRALSPEGKSIKQKKVGVIFVVVEAQC